MKRLIFLIISTALLASSPRRRLQAAARRRRRGVHDLQRGEPASALVVYDRAADGSLASAGSVSTGGVGTGGGLASQGAVTLTDDGHTVLAVNPGSNSVAAFAVGHDGPQLLNTAPSGGTRPVSVAVHKQPRLRAQQEQRRARHRQRLHARQGRAHPDRRLDALPARRRDRRRRR